MLFALRRPEAELLHEAAKPSRPWILRATKPPGVPKIAVAPALETLPAHVTVVFGALGARGPNRPGPCSSVPRDLVMEEEGKPTKVLAIGAEGFMLEILGEEHDGRWRFHSTHDSRTLADFAPELAGDGLYACTRSQAGSRDRGVERRSRIARSGAVLATLARIRASAIR
jgi:hypothetical protein